MGQVVAQRELIFRRGHWKQTGLEVVCAYGAFDLLHPGHIRLLEEARRFGDLLVVAVQSDEAVRATAATTNIVGHSPTSDAVDKPITPAEERAEIVAALRAVDFAAVTGDPLAEFLRNFRPDVFVCGDKPNRQATSRVNDALETSLAAIGCKVARVPVEPGYSTSRLIELITGRRA